MKKLVLITIGALSSLGGFAQIPNSGFETWTTVGSYTNPTSWGTMNNTTATYNLYTAIPGTPGSPGTSYLKLTSKTINGNVVNGMAVSGVIDSINLKAKSGFAFNMQPQSLTGKWQHMIYGSSQGSVKAILTKWNGSLMKRDTVATAVQALAGMAMSWANFTISFTYLNGLTPDSCIIELKASGSNPTNNDYLWVDNLAFSGSVTGLVNVENLNSNISLFPNPSDENLTVELNLAKTSNVTLQLVDITGKMIRENNLGSINGSNKHNFNIAGIAKGSYFINVIANNSHEVRKIIIE